ncbi:sugar phosphate isomerase/epimerase [Arthrobacter sp. FX8]|uniref:sugar phosphate isomerase/epimerase family protein n=1 Tax=unclassified Arthrobacter TaxID=235627 RepID=UPI0006F275D8|nr:MULTISPECIES: sugar phosphate isomerase/epimerase family protein [unclassified Arthrobacter]KRE68216.1 xylose isomerase [Arthrobacter sp. Soil761]TWD54718.1 sugar phosphate isomerase/epimerase [Arthrobacter sp. AG367]WAJ32605.1 sugar phosphate isomerase/epimerase [Arthrobacter sp. FX8]
MRFAGHTLGTPHHTVPQALKLFRDAGLDAAEVIYQNGYTSGLPLGDRRAAMEALTAADGEGLPILGLTPYTTAINSLDESQWRGGVDEFRGAIETAHLLGADRVRVYAGAWHPGDTDRDRRWAKLREALQTLAPEAEQAGVRLCVENHFGTMTQTAAETAALVREVAHPAVRVLYDQANLTFTHDETFEEAFAVQGDLIGHVHVKDLVFTDPNAAFRATETARVDASERAVRSRVIGTGVLPWPQILAALLRHGYDDLLSIEYEYRWHPQDLPTPEDGFRESVTALRGMLTDLAEMENAR